MTETLNIKTRKLRESGRALAIFIWIFVLILLLIGAAIASIHMGWIKLPEQLANQPWLAPLLPKPPQQNETKPEPIEKTAEQNLIDQVLLLRNELGAAQATIDALHQQLDEKDRTIQQLTDEIARLTNALNLSANQELSSVALIYEAMEPSEAAKILANMGAQQASLILGGMRESKAADILALMDPSIATEITRLMAGFTQAPSPQTPETTPPPETPSTTRSQQPSSSPPS